MTNVHQSPAGVSDAETRRNRQFIYYFIFNYVLIQKNQPKQSSAKYLPQWFQPNNQTRASVQEMQVIQRREGLFNNSTEYIYHPSKFKTERTNQSTKPINRNEKPVWSSFFSSVKVTNIRVDWNNNSISFRI